MLKFLTRTDDKFLEAFLRSREAGSADPRLGADPVLVGSQRAADVRAAHAGVVSAPPTAIRQLRTCSGPGPGRHGVRDGDLFDECGQRHQQPEAGPGSLAGAGSGGGGRLRAPASVTVSPRANSRSAQPTIAPARSGARAAVGRGAGAAAELRGRGVIPTGTMAGRSMAVGGPGLGAGDAMFWGDVEPALASRLTRLQPLPFCKSRTSEIRKSARVI